MARPHIGLALGSGSARGWSHIGIIDALIEANVEPSIVCGTSMGIRWSRLCGRAIGRVATMGRSRDLAGSSRARGRPVHRRRPDRRQADCRLSPPIRHDGCNRELFQALRRRRHGQFARHQPVALTISRSSTLLAVNCSPGKNWLGKQVPTTRMSDRTVQARGTTSYLCERQRRPDRPPPRATSVTTSARIVSVGIRYAASASLVSFQA